MDSGIDGNEGSDVAEMLAAPKAMAAATVAKCIICLNFICLLGVWLNYLANTVYVNSRLILAFIHGFQLTGRQDDNLEARRQAKSFQNDHVDRESLKEWEAGKQAKMGLFTNERQTRNWTNVLQSRTPESMHKGNNREAGKRIGIG